MVDACPVLASKQLQVVQLLDNATYIAIAIAVRVAKGSRVDLQDVKTQ
jgi:hypothetical protein